MQFLYPFKIDDWHDTNLEVRILSDIDFVSDDSAMQAFVEKKIGVLRRIFPGCECARLRAVKLSLIGIVYVASCRGGAGLSKIPECFFKLVKQVRVGAKMAEVIDPKGDNDEKIVFAAKLCPVKAIFLEEEGTGKKIFP